MSLKTITTTCRSALSRIGAFIAQMFAFDGMYERKAVYVRHRFPA